MANEVQDVANAHTALSTAVAAARKVGYRVTFQTTGNDDPNPVVSGGPEPVKQPAPQPEADDQH